MSPDGTPTDLYLLVFREEPLVKVGYSKNIYLRAQDLGISRFNLRKSYSIRCRLRWFASTVEMQVKRRFADYQIVSMNPLRGANTETFDASILPDILQFVREFSTQTLRVRPCRFRCDLTNTFSTKTPKRKKAQAAAANVEAKNG
jgi:hypothetical protein